MNTKECPSSPLERIVGRRHDKLTVYLATNIYGETCHFGCETTARAWAKSGTVLPITVRTPPELHEVGGSVDDAQSIKNLSKALADVTRERDKLRDELKQCKVNAERYMVLRDEESWPAVFGASSATAPLRGFMLDAAMDIVMRRGHGGWMLACTRDSADTPPNAALSGTGTKD